jgi:hypothetical protein
VAAPLARPGLANLGVEDEALMTRLEADELGTVDAAIDAEHGSAMSEGLPGGR